VLKTNSSNKATTAHLKQHNEALLLREIYAHASISRVRLAQLTHLSRPAVTELTQTLIEKNLILELGPEQVLDKVGKKPTLLALNPDAYQAVCLVLTDTTAIGSLVNLRIEVIEQQSIPIGDLRSDDLINLIIDLLQSVLQFATCPLLGISIGTPGIVDSQAGIVHLATKFGWHELELARLLSDRFKLPIYIGNDSNFAAMGEHRFGLAQGIQDVVLVEVGDGVGVGILADGRIIRGSTHAAGELGHIHFPPLDDVCLCGRRGCLETIVTWWGIRQHALRIAQQPDSLLNSLLDDGEISAASIVKALAKKDPHTIALVEQAGNYLGHALVMVTHLLNPSCIILSGSILELGETFIHRVEQTIRDHTLPYISSQTKIIVNQLNDKSILLGAGAFLLEGELGL
jgi:N-acetylglucosamine repressor